MQNVLIAGAGGFIGTHVTREAARFGGQLTLVSHRRRPPVPLGGRASTRVVRMNLAEPDSVRGLCDGVDAVLHCASRIGGSAEANEAVNARGTAALVAEAQRAGVPRIVYLSTASVYGRGVFRNALPEHLPRRPLSHTSRTRAEAEDAVLDAGGIVVRPHLVLGPGDAWVRPALRRLLGALHGTPAGWDARLSVIAVAELAELIVALGRAPREQLSSSVYHAAYPQPVTAGELLRSVATRAALPPTGRTVDPAQARALLAGDGTLTRVLEMLATDHWFDSTPLWDDLGRSAGSGRGVDAVDMSEWDDDLPAAV
ncbi:NAD-dependent epimerase/dehydratase family protein [Streptomyces sp. NPDC019224]|uniref:NAD-dependent epimerase/dehydratase family protein n=1 Tax=Streptomyces sp. NPDC019224 TaxID=3154484 RepID=UPI0033C277E4